MSDLVYLSEVRFKAPRIIEITLTTSQSPLHTVTKSPSKTNFSFLDFDVIIKNFFYLNF